MAFVKIEGLCWYSFEISKNAVLRRRKIFRKSFLYHFVGHFDPTYVQNFRSKGSFFKNHSVTLLKLRFSESVSRAIQDSLYIFELDLIASFQIRLITCLIIFYYSKVAVYGPNIRYESSKKEASRKSFWALKKIVYILFASFVFLFEEVKNVYFTDVVYFYSVPSFQPLFLTGGSHSILRSLYLHLLILSSHCLNFSKF